MITKIQAATLYGYNYQLQDNEGNVWDINSIIGESHFSCWVGDRNKNVGFEKIGSTYKILARPLEDLTKEIEGVGVPIVELAKICITHEDIKWEMSDDGFAFCTSKYGFNYIFSYRPSGMFHFNSLIGTPNQLALFNWLYTHHFNFFPEGTTTNLI